VSRWLIARLRGREPRPCRRTPGGAIWRDDFNRQVTRIAKNIPAAIKPIKTQVSHATFSVTLKYNPIGGSRISANASNCSQNLFCAFDLF
jgi:hypothetical protein